MEPIVKIISHRGFWKQPAEKNSIDAIAFSVKQGFGTETDVRDSLGRLVVSHDPARGGEPAWDTVVDIFAGTGLPLAVNIKADGMTAMLSDAFAGKNVDWFAFDMSGPETVRIAQAGLPFFTRHSDVEPEPLLYSAAQGVWLDAFRAQWFDDAVIRMHLATSKRVCIVSPELHGRDPMSLWPLLAKYDDAVILCTDIPDRAEAFFE